MLNICSPFSIVIFMPSSSGSRANKDCVISIANNLTDRSLGSARNKEYIFLMKDLVGEAELPSWYRL
jgi:hypothetical protein